MESSNVTYEYSHEYSTWTMFSPIRETRVGQVHLEEPGVHMLQLRKERIYVRRELTE